VGDDAIPDPLDDAVEAIRRQDAGALSIRVEKRRYGKDVTILEGFPRETQLDELARTLKRRLATGGSAKDDHIELQGDVAKRVKTVLVDLGYAAP
jgi:translation initiation factor 1